MRDLARYSGASRNPVTMTSNSAGYNLCEFLACFAVQSSVFTARGAKIYAKNAKILGIVNVV